MNSARLGMYDRLRQVHNKSTGREMVYLETIALGMLISSLTRCNLHYTQISFYFIHARIAYTTQKKVQEYKNNDGNTYVCLRNILFLF